MIVGSMNWSKSGDHKNDENTLVIENNETIAGEFHSYFETLWNALPNNASNFNASSLFMESEASERELEMLEVD